MANCGIARDCAFIDADPIEAFFTAKSALAQVEVLPLQTSKKVYLLDMPFPVGNSNSY